jgi:uncharacterized alkaline shock family protein YloU
MFDVDVTCVILYKSNISSISMLQCQTIRVEFTFDIDVTCVILYKLNLSSLSILHVILYESNLLSI